MGLLKTLARCPCAGALLLAVVCIAPSLLAAQEAEGPRSTAATSFLAAETMELRSNLDRLLLASSWRDAEWGVLVVSLDHGDTLYAVNPDEPLAPASNVKLLTTAAALQTLGPEYRFVTYLMTNGTVEDGVLHGDLILYGTGDPGISSRFHSRRDEAFHRLVDQLDSLGIREVRGDLVADASFLPGPQRPVGWDPRDLNDHFTAAVSALSFNENVVSVRIAPGDVGAPPRVQTIPDNAGIEVLNLAETVPGSRPRVAMLRDDPLEPVRVEGTIGAGVRDVWRQFTVSDPTVFTASVFRSLLADREIDVRGVTRTVSRPGRSDLPRLSAPFAGKRGVRVLARHTSEPLQSYLEVVNKQSHNLFAELVFRVVGRSVAGVGSIHASARAVGAALADLGVDTTGMILVDGSGLSAGNRVTAGMLVDVIDRMARSPSWGHYWATLPEAGRPRELGRMYRTAAAGNLRAKTGTIERVSALSGVVGAADGERLAFSILLNRAPSVARAKAVENQIGARLASFQRGMGSRIDGERLARAENPSPPYAGTERHRIRPGENLTLIARRYGVSIDALLGANPRVEANRVLAGQWLVIPTIQEAGGS
jgi:serine-type D-Ala-D-Ala carboxypeptidase/endopeptidase (penicillin-binding protein 4)